MFRQLAHLLTLISILTLLVTPVHAANFATAQQPALEAKLGPGIDAQKFPPSAPLVILFNQAMDSASAQPALLTFPYLAGTETWDAEHKTLTFQAQDGFPGDEEVQVFLNSDLRAQGGAAFKETQQWTLMVQPGPQVVSRWPTDYELALRQPSFSIQFDREMDLESLQSAIQLEPALPFTLKASRRKIDINLSQALDPGAVVKLNLAATAQDTTGTKLDRRYAWSYRILPFELTELVCKRGRIDFKLSYRVPIDLLRKTIQVDPPITGEWLNNVGDRGYSIEPPKPLAWAQRYTISFIGDLQDSTGLTLPLPKPVTCSVEPVFSVTPNDQEGIGTHNQVQVAFRTPMDEASVKNGFSIQPAVPGKLLFQQDLHHIDYLTFTPDESFLAGTYTITLAKSILTAEKEPLLGEPYQWQFKVVKDWYSEKTAAFTDYGPNIQVIDADAPRYLQFTSHQPDIKLFFDVYPLDLPTFVERYKDSFGFMYSYSSSSKGISTDGLQRQQEFSFTAKQGVNDLLLPAGLPAGLYVFNMRSEQGLLDQIFIVLSRNAITAKLSGTRLFTWTTNINGESAADVEIRVYTQTGELLREGKADEQGIFDTSRPFDSNPMLVAARDQDGDITLTGLSYNWTSHNDNGYWYGDYGGISTQRTPQLSAYIFTDRPIYRPGNTVYYKAILRNNNDLRYTAIPREKPLTVRLLDARDNLLAEQEQYLNEFGTLNGEYTLSPEGNLGSYTLEVVGPAGSELHDTIRQIFYVEEYHKPDYSVSLQTAKTEFVDGEDIELTVDARYFLGQPVANAAVTLKFFNYWEKPTTVSGTTGADGKYIYKGVADFEKVIPWYSYDASYNWGRNLQSAIQAVEVTVSDGSNQPVSAVTGYTIYTAAEGIDLNTHGYFKTPGEPFNVDVQTVTYAGKPVANRKIQVIVYGRGKDSYSNYRWNTEISSSDAVTGADGKAVVEIKLEQAADYRVVVKSNDSGGEDLYNNAWVTAYKPGWAWAFETDDEFSIHVEGENYQPYQRAKLLVRSTFSGPALLTFERGTVLHTQLVELTAPQTEIETQIIPEYAPNVYITINAWQNKPFAPYQPPAKDEYVTATNRPNSRLRLASLELKVDPLEKPLTISVTADKTSYAPREKAEFTIQVDGKQQAELAIGLVDEAIYSLKNEPWKPIYEAFYGEREHTVSTYDSMAIVRYLYDAGGRGGGGGEAPSLSSPRAQFPDTAIWLPAVVTDAQGKAVVSLTLPDTLTRWRLTVRAVTRSTHVGETTFTIQTEQPISLRPAFPSLVTTGDRFELVAYVHNTSAAPQALTAVLAVTGLTVTDPASQTITVQPGEYLPLRWQAEVDDAGTGEVTVQVSGGSGLGDAIRIPIAIQPRATLNIDQRSGQFSGQLDLPVFIPPTALSFSGAHLELYRSLAGNALSGLESLIGYPYGCVEQTMSKALPNAVVGRALKRLDLSKPELEQKLPGLIDSGVKRLYGMQHFDGGWGWWTDDVTDPYQTAWVVFGLAVTRDAGYPVDVQVIQRGAHYLRGSMGLSVAAKDKEKDWSQGKVSDLNPKLKAFMLYSLALAGEGDVQSAIDLYQDYPALDPFSQSALALALHRLGREQEAGQIVSELESTALRENGEAYWPGSTEDGVYHQKTMSSEVRTAAMALEAIQTIHPQSKLTAEIVHYLMGRKQIDGWGTTNETAFTLLALTGQLETTKGVVGPTNYRVLLDGKEIAQVDWKSEDLTAVYDLPQNALGAGLSRLEVIPDNDATLYYSLGIKLYEDASAAQPAGNINITREYLDGVTGKALTTFEAGQLIQVRLKITTRSAVTAYVLVEDHLPGGIEALNERLNTSSREFNEQSFYYYQYVDYGYSDMDLTNPFQWELYGYNNKEIHDGRVSFFITSLENNGGTFTYYARALRSGTFTALPAEVSAMYNPSEWGRTDSAVIIVKK